MIRKLLLASTGLLAQEGSKDLDVSSVSKSRLEAFSDGVIAIGPGFSPGVLADWVRGPPMDWLVRPKSESTGPGS